MSRRVRTIGATWAATTTGAMFLTEVAGLFRDLAAVKRAGVGLPAGPLLKTVVREIGVKTLEAVTNSEMDRDRVGMDGLAIVVRHMAGTWVPLAAPTARVCGEVRSAQDIRPFLPTDLRRMNWHS